MNSATDSHTANKPFRYPMQEAEIRRIAEAYFGNPKYADWCEQAIRKAFREAARSEIDAQEIRKKAILDCANMVMGRLAGRQEGSDLWLEICKIANMLRREGDIEKLSAPCVARRAVEEIKAIIQKHVPLPGWAYEDEIVRVVRECERNGE